MDTAVSSWESDCSDSLLFGREILPPGDQVSADPGSTQGLHDADGGEQASTRIMYHAVRRTLLSRGAEIPRGQRRIQMTEYEIHFQGTRLQPDQLLAEPVFSTARDSVIAVGFDPGDPSRIHAFASEPEFEAWSASTPHAEKVRDGRKSMAKIKERGDRDREQLVRSHEKEMTRVTKEAEKLSRETGLPWPSEQLFRLGHDRGVFHSLLLFDRPHYGGGWRFFIFPGLPDLKWVGFDNLASSYLVSGWVGAMYEHAWYGGRVFWTLGFPIWGVPDLSVFGWDNIASSLWLAG